MRAFSLYISIAGGIVLTTAEHKNWPGVEMEVVVFPMEAVQSISRLSKQGVHVDTSYTLKLKELQ